MGKSNRRRKLDRAKRDARASQRRVAVERRRATADRQNATIDLYDEICDPSTAVGEVPGLLDALYQGGPVVTWLVPLMLLSDVTPERLAAVADAMLAGPPGGSAAGTEAEADTVAEAGTEANARAEAEPRPSVTALSFAAAVASARQDIAEFRRLIHQALAATSDPVHRVGLITQLQRGGRAAEAIELLEATLRADPGDDVAAGCYGEAIGDVFARVHQLPSGDGGEDSEDTCPCGLGTPWSQCCEPAERAALDRFADRSGLDAMRAAVGTWLAASDYGPVVDAKVTQIAELLPADHGTGWEAADRAELAALVAEHALISVHAHGKDNQPDDAGKQDHTGEQDHTAEQDRTAEQDHTGESADNDADTPLAAFAAAPEIPAEFASRASTWRQHARYGLWRIDDPRPAPGLWCTEVVSGLIRYVQFPAEIAERMPRWAVWLGAIVPVDGIWRCTGTGMRLSPAEGDAAAEFVGEATSAIVEELTGAKTGSARPHRAWEPLGIGETEPHGVLQELTDPAAPELARLYGLVTGELLSRIAVELRAYRADPPVLRNMDGDPAYLVTARIAVDDGPKLAARLAKRPGFEADPADPASITWYGLRVPSEQAEALMVETMTRRGAHGHPETELAQGPQRWVRGTLRIFGDQIVADVNSARRLDLLIGVLERIGANPSVIEDKRIGPLLDMPWPAGQHAVPSAAAPAADGWEKSWLDEPVPALGGHSPRLAARTDDWPLLEGLLRQWEYEADLLAAEGKRGIDTDWLREQLDLLIPDYQALQRWLSGSPVMTDLSIM